MQEGQTNMDMGKGSYGAAEQIDWNSFVDLEYDPTIASTSEQASSSADEGAFQHVSPNTEQSDRDDILQLSGDASLAALGFPSLDEWWADLPENLESEPLDTWTGHDASQGNTPHSDSNSSFYLDWQSPELQGEDGARKRRKRIPPEAKRLLAECFETHKENPYVPKEQLESLAKKTDLTLRQVQTYFANARARKLPRPTAQDKGVDIPATSQQQDPMQRFLSSSPEDEGISEEVVRTAANQMNRPIKPLRSRKGKTPSVRSSSQSSTSASSTASIDSLDSRGSRKGRKRQREPAHNVAKTIFRKPSSPSRKYQCTFCTNDFEQKYDWKRHEESVHFPQKEWVCMPNGPLEDLCCVFCGADGVDGEHLASHKSTPCSDIPWAQRTFQRKDKLVQHIKQVHGCGPPKMIKTWCRPIERNVLLLCGFCSLELPNWKDRADHISLHFNNNIDMTLWLPELLGGIWPADDLTTNFVRDRFSATETPHGNVPCDLCPARFVNLRQLTLHRRQAHNLYRPTDSKVVMSKPTAGHHSQRLINLAQQTSRIQISRVGGAPGSPGRLGGAGPQPSQPDYSAMLAKVKGAKPMPMGMRATVDRRLDSPENQGFVSPSCVSYAKVVNQGAVMPSRAPPMRNPLVPHAMAGPARRSALGRPSSLRSGAGEGTAGGHRYRYVEVEVEGGTMAPVESGVSGANTTGPPVDAIRSILRNNRDGVENVNRPAQGMLHSLEQFDATDVPWPRPPDI